MPGFGDTGKIDRSKYRFVWISFAEWERGKLPAVEGGDTQVYVRG